MENKEKFVIGAFLVVVLVGFVSCSQPAKNTEKEAINRKVEYVSPEYETLTVDRLIPIQLTFNSAVKIEAIKDGKLKKGDVSWKNGAYVKKGQLLVQLSFDKEYAELNTLKKNLADEVSVLIQHPKVANTSLLMKKWQLFLDEVSPAKRLPAFPLIDSEEEKQALKQTLIGKFYVRATALESAIEEAFVFATKSGWLMNIRCAIGDDVTHGKVLAEMVQKNDWQINNSAVIDSLLGDEWKLVSSNKKDIGTLFRLSSLKKKKYQLQIRDGIDLNQTIKLFVKSQFTIQTSRIPVTSIENNRVTYLEENKEKIVQVEVVKRTKDSLWVTGLPENKQLRLINKI